MCIREQNGRVRLLLFLTAGSLVQVAPTAMRRAPTCEEQLQAVYVDPSICEKIRLAESSVRKAVLDIDAKVRSKNFNRDLNSYREPRQEGLDDESRLFRSLHIRNSSSAQDAREISF